MRVEPRHPVITNAGPDEQGIEKVECVAHAMSESGRLTMMNCGALSLWEKRKVIKKKETHYNEVAAYVQLKSGKDDRFVE